jgi:hypothetical protein
MTLAISCFVAVVCLCLATTNGTHGVVADADSSTDDRYILIGLYNSTGRSSWTEPWPVGDNSIHVCTWTGVTCDGTSVTQIDVAHRGLRGVLPAELANLTTLQKFTASNNTLNGTLSPYLSAWGTSIIYLDLGNNNISGTLPKEYSNWTHLQTFDVSSNYLEESLPDEFGNWTEIQTFAIHNNSFSGTLPSSYAAWSKVKHFHVRENQLSGMLPQNYSNCTLLEVFTLSFNHFTGGIPSRWMHVLKVVALLDVSSNNLSGTLPNTLAPSLKAALFDNNNFEGELPKSWWSAAHLLFLSLQGNPLLVGPIPPAWMQSFFPVTLSVGGFLSLCQTSVCTTRNSSLNLFNRSFICFPTTNRDVVYELALLDPGQEADAIPLLMNVVQHSPDLIGGGICATAPPPLTTPSPTTAPPSSPAALTWSSFDAVKKSTAVITSATSGVGLLSAGGDAGDAQMLAAVLSSSCACGFNATAADSNGASVMNFAASPFSLLADPVYIVIGNPLIALVLFTVQLLLVSRRLPPPSSTTSPQEPAEVDSRGQLFIVAPFVSSEHPASTFLKLRKALQLRLRLSCSPQHHAFSFESKGQRSGQGQAVPGCCCTCASIRAQYRYPNLAIAVSLFLAPGVVAAIVKTCSSTPIAIGSPSPVALRVVGILCGVCFVFGLAAVIEFVVFRDMVNKGSIRVHVPAPTSNSPPDSRRRHKKKAATHASPPAANVPLDTIRREPRLRFRHYKNSAAAFAPIPRTISDILMPCGHWFPNSERLSVGGIVASINPARSSCRAWLWLPIVNCFTQFVAALPLEADENPSSCDAAQSVIVLALFGCAALIAVRRPFRAPLASIVAATTLALVGTVSILQMACRHNPASVSRAEISAYATFVSITLFLLKVYIIGVPLLERHLATKNNVASVALDDSAITNVAPVTTKTTKQRRLIGSNEIRASSQPQGALPPPDDSCDDLVNHLSTSMPSLSSSLMPRSIARASSPRDMTSPKHNRATMVEQWRTMTQDEALAALIGTVCCREK